MELGTGLVLAEGRVCPAGGATATQVVIRRRRTYLLVHNASDTYTAYLGSTSAITSSTGMALAPGAYFTYEHYNDAVYVYSTGTGDLRYTEVD